MILDLFVFSLYGALPVFNIVASLYAVVVVGFYGRVVVNGYFMTKMAEWVKNERKLFTIRAYEGPGVSDRHTNGRSKVSFHIAPIKLDCMTTDSITN